MHPVEIEVVDNLFAVGAAEILTLEELCGYLKVKPSWVYFKTHQGVLPHFKVGRHLRFEKTKILEYLRSSNANTR